MNLIVCLAALAAAETEVRFEPEGVRVGEALIRTALLQFRDLDEGSIIVSGTTIEPLTAAVRVKLGAGHVIVLEPGVRAVRGAGGYTLTTHGRRPIQLGTSAFPSPVTLKPTAKGWDLGAGRVLTGLSLATRLCMQDDVDANIEALKQAARKIMDAMTDAPPADPVVVNPFEANPVPPPTFSEAEFTMETSPTAATRRTMTVRVRRVFDEDPSVWRGLYELVFLQPSAFVSPAGF